MTDAESGAALNVRVSCSSLSFFVLLNYFFVVSLAFEICTQLFHEQYVHAHVHTCNHNAVQIGLIDLLLMT